MTDNLVRTDNTETLHNALKRIAELEQELSKMKEHQAEVWDENAQLVVKLRKEISELKQENVKLANEVEQLKVEADFNEKACEGATMMYNDLKAAWNLIENIIRVTWGEGWNYSLDWKEKAEQFLKETKR